MRTCTGTMSGMTTCGAQGVQAAEPAKNQPTWREDVKMAQNITIGLIEALLLFKVGMMLLSHSSWGAPTLAVAALVSMIFGAVYMSRDNAGHEVGQLEHIYTSTLGRIVALAVVELLTVFVIWLIGDIYIISQMVTVLVAFVVAFKGILTAGWYISKKNNSQTTVGVMKAFAKSKARRLGMEPPPDDQFTNREPQEVSGWGLLISVAASNALDVVLAEVVDQFDATKGHPLLT